MLSLSQESLHPIHLKQVEERPTKIKVLKEMKKPISDGKKLKKKKKKVPFEKLI